MSGKDYNADNPLASAKPTFSNNNPQVSLNKADTASQAERRRITREVGALWNDIGLAASFTPIELRTAWAIEVRLDEMGRGPDSRRWVSNAAIGLGLVSNTKDIEHAKRTARNRVGHLFNKAIPRSGYQILTRYKVGDDEQHPNEFVSHLMPVAAFFSELLAEELKAISKLDSALRADAKAEARQRIIAEALTYLPKCDTELIGPDGELYAYISEPEAKAFCKSKDGYAVRPIQPKEPKAEKPKKPFFADDFDRLKLRAVKEAVDTILDAIGERNGKDTARAFWVRELLPALEHAGERWVNYCRLDDDEEIEEEREENYPTEENPVRPPTLEPLDSDTHLDGGGEEKLSPLTLDKPSDNSNLVPQISDTLDSATRQDGADGVTTLATSALQPTTLEPNFDDTLEAAIDYVRDGWAIVPCCQFDPATGRCTGPESHHADDICKGKVPLIKGKKPIPGAGYTAAARDKGLVTDWFTRQFPAAGVAIRLDGHILIDCDVKNGARGIESYEVLADTFELDATLSAITPSGGRHYIFKLPEDLPADYLGSWTRILDGAELDGIDIKVGVKGLAHVEPSRGVAGVYRWIDPTAEIAELPRACCDYLHEVHELATLPKPTSGASGNVSTFDPDEDQGKYFRDAPNGERRPRLRSIACCLAAGGANESQIVSVLNYHDSRFTEPTNDAKFIARVAQGAVSKFAQGVTQ